MRPPKLSKCASCLRQLDKPNEDIHLKYLCLISAETFLEQMSDAEARQHLKEYAGFTDEIRSSGHFVTANRLKPPNTATTVRVRNGKVLLTDGPFAETTEHVGGYCLIEAANLDDAVRIAAKIPGARIGSVEVRPVADDPQTLALGLDN